MAGNGRAKSLALVAIDGASPGLRIALIQSVQAVSTFDSRILFDLVRPIAPTTLEELFGQITESTLQASLRKLASDRAAFRAISLKLEHGERKRLRLQSGPLEGFEVEDQEWRVPINEQFKDELRRMTKFDKDLSTDGPYRLNSGPFYFKLVKRNASTNTSGIMLSLGHLEQMIADGMLSGPKSGLRISYRALNGHYLRSEPFVELVRSGYVGTRGATTEHLLTLIDAALIGGRAVVALIQSAIHN